MRLESGPASGDRNYFLGATVVCLGMAVWFLYDGLRGWPAANLEAAGQQLAQLEGKPVDSSNLPERPYKGDYDALLAKSPKSLEDVRAALGDPIHSKETAVGETTSYFASRYGLATVPSIGGHVDAARMNWKTWHKSHDDVVGQIYWALIPLALALYTGFRLIRAVTLRVQIDETGMNYAGRQIAFDAMTALRDYSAKGWIDLYYRDGAGERKLRIDNQKVKRFDEIIAALCAAKGFQNPLPAADESANPDEAA
ncbi:MAG: hypothetical protein U1D55_10925 [Phycisphaerae bacterium]